MKVSYHPSIELLTAYSAASLPLSQALCVAAHLEMCATCKQNYQRLNKLGAYLFVHAENSAGKDTATAALREKVFGLLDHKPAATPSNHKRKVDTQIDPVPRCLQQYVKDSYDALPWKWISPSIKQATLYTDHNGAQVALMRIKPGGRIGHHTHTGDEYTMVLKGAFSDETGIFQQGDFVLRSGHHRHSPIATKDSECICLTVVEAPIRFTGFFTRWLNPILRLTHPARLQASRR